MNRHFLPRTTFAARSKPQRRNDDVIMRVGFIGYGNMADALARGFVNAGIVKWSELTMCNKSNVDRRASFSASGGTVVETAADVVKASDVVFLAVKPQYVRSVLVDVHRDANLEAASTLFVSVAAGVTLDTMESVWTDNGEKTPEIVRVMPNTPCLVGAAASGLCAGTTCVEKSRNVALALMSSVGMCKVINENQMSALTAVSGSGPAYVFILIEGLSDGGVRAGLPRDVATQLAAQTFYGAAKMVLETGKHPGELKDSVCSPGGTTIAGVHALEQAGVRQAMMNAVVAAAARGDELARASAGK